MMYVRQYSAIDVEQLVLQEAQGWGQELLSNPRYAMMLDLPGLAFSAVHEEVVVGCAGVYPEWAGRAIAWALIPKESKRYLHYFTKEVRKFLDSIRETYPRIEAYVRCDFPPGHTWAVLCGFKMEAPFMQRFGPEGANYSMYARVRCS